MQFPISIKVVDWHRKKNYIFHNQLGTQTGSAVLNSVLRMSTCICVQCDAITDAILRDPKSSDSGWLECMRSSQNSFDSDELIWSVVKCLHVLLLIVKTVRIELLFVEGHSTGKFKLKPINDNVMTAFEIHASVPYYCKPC